MRFQHSREWETAASQARWSQRVEKRGDAGNSMVPRPWNESMQHTTAILFQTHFFDRWCARAFRRISAACPASYRPVVLIHLPAGAPAPPLLRRVPHHIVRTPELRLPAYPAKSGGAEWNLWKGGHTDLIFLHYARANPEHAYYWSVEYDVRFSGDWSRFFGAFTHDSADLLAPAILPRNADPGWYNWDSLSGPSPLPESEQLRAFLPVFRTSAALVRVVDEAYRAGWGGHCEGTWPSLARAAGLSVCDLGGDGPFTPARYRGRFYSSTPLSENLAPGTFVFKPPLYRPGRKPEMLWHPVKPFFWRAEVKEGLRDIRRRAGILVRRFASLAGIRLPPALQEGAFEAAARRRVGTKAVQSRGVASERSTIAMSEKSRPPRCNRPCQEALARRNGTS